MKIPECPNHLKSKSICERSDLRLVGENEHAFVFNCHTCKLIWSVSKPRTKERARFENRARKIQTMSESDREKSARRLYSFPSR